MKALLALLLFTTLNAHAATRYETIKALFDAGTPLSIHDLDAAYAGRCFYAPTKPTLGLPGSDDATGAFLDGRVEKKDADNAGPAFHSVTSITTVSLANGAAEAAGRQSAAAFHYRFDHYSRESLNEFVDANPDFVGSPVIESGRDLKWTVTIGPDTRLIVARRSGSYIVLNVDFQTDATLGPVTMACYFFKQLL